MAKWFGTDGIRGKANQFPIIPEFAVTLARVCGSLLCSERKKVAIARDTRISGEMLEAALSAGFAAQGIDVLLLGVLPTPALTLLTESLNVDMAVMITASHNPYTDNGIKLLNGSGGRFDDTVIASIEEAVELNRFAASAEVGRIRHLSGSAADYASLAIKALEGFRLDGLRVVLDCANGAFSEIMPEVFMNAGAGVIVIGNKPDGVNINKECGSQHTECLCDMVVKTHADLGIAVDGDGDRIIICDEAGHRLDGDQIIAFLATTLQRNGKLAHNAAVATIMSNPGLDDYLQKQGIQVYRSAVGEKNVIAKMQELKANLGGEESGHMVVSDYARTGDGMITALLVAKGYLQSGKKMSELFPVFEPYPCSETDVYFADRDEISAAVKNEEILSAVEAVRSELGSQGCVIFRKSGTEPLIKVKVMGKNAERIRQMNETIRDKMNKYQIAKVRVVR